eukprot:GILI01029996.1.p1 GENE.GILI01029996.1~~GILI01029996.1.p1  ORF type:complete len:479 (+),score=113.49 GILI01029996.1:460-1896(+)
MTSPSSSQHRYNRVLKSSTPTAPQASGEMDFSVPRAGPTDPFSSSPPTYQDSSYPQYTSYGSAVLTNDMNRNANWGEVSSAPHSGNSRTPPGLSGLGGFLRTNNLSQPTAPNSGAPNSGASHQSHNRNVEPVTSHLGGKFPSAPQPAGVSQPSSYGGPSRGTPSAHFTGGDIVSSLTNILQTPPTIIHAQSQSHGPAPPQAVGTGSNAAGLNLLAKLQGNAATIVTPSTSTRRIPAGMLQQPSAVSPPSILPMAPNMITKTANQQGTSTPASNVTPFTQANPNPTPSSTKTPSSAQTKNAASPSANQAKQAKQQQQQQQQQAYSQHYMQQYQMAAMQAAAAAATTQKPPAALAPLPAPSVAAPHQPPQQQPYVDPSVQALQQQIAQQAAQMQLLQAQLAMQQQQQPVQQQSVQQPPVQQAAPLPAAPQAQPDAATQMYLRAYAQQQASPIVAATGTEVPKPQQLPAKIATPPPTPPLP